MASVLTTTLAVASPVPAAVAQDVAQTTIIKACKDSATAGGGCRSYHSRLTCCCCVITLGNWGQVHVHHALQTQVWCLCLSVPAAGRVLWHVSLGKEHPVAVGSSSDTNKRFVLRKTVFDWRMLATVICLTL